MIVASSDNKIDRGALEHCPLTYSLSLSPSICGVYYVLSQVGPKRKRFSVSDKLSCGWDAKLMVREICQIYCNLSLDAISHQQQWQLEEEVAADPGECCRNPIGSG